MLTCKEFLQELTDYLDSTVDAELRVKLERDPEEPRHFLTVRGHGYRFEK